MNITTASRQLITNVSSNRRHLTILLLGFASGLPASLTASTLQAWFTDAGINLRTIGAVTLLVMPYSFKFLWSPLFDYVQFGQIDRRRGWLIVTQLGLLASIIWMALLTPQDIAVLFNWQIPWLLIAGFLTSFLSASQDIVINAYQTEILPKSEQGLGASLYVTGWRVGAIISGALALVLASEFGWECTYLGMSSLMGIGLLATFIAPPSQEYQQSTYGFLDAVVAPFVDFFQRFGIKSAVLFLLLIITYKISDALALALNTTFLMRELGFALSTIGYINKTVSLTSALLGGIFAGILMTRQTLYRSLMLFGFVQGAANLSYAAMAYWGKSLGLLIFAAFTENFCSGMGTIALMALIMSLCNKRYTATQFALLSAVAFLARTFVGPLAATMVESSGWFLFFICCFLISLPTLAFAHANRHVIHELRNG